MRILRVAGLLFSVVATPLLMAAPAGATDWVTYNFDNSRSGVNTQETALSVENAPAIVPLVPTINLNGDGIDAQPLYSSSESTPLGVTNLVYVATERNVLYAYSPKLKRMVWSRYLGPPVPSSQGSCSDTAPWLGVTSTPVLDKATDTLYFVYNTMSGLGNGWPHYYLGAISASSGGNFGVSPLIFGFNDNPQYVKQRPALLEANGKIYVAFGSHCDVAANASWGRIFAFDKTTLQQTNRFDLVNVGDTRCTDQFGGRQYLASVWMSGGGMAADANGNIYFTTGNGCVLAGDGDYGMALVRLNSNLQFPTDRAHDTWQPCNANSLSIQDLDYGSGGVALHTDPYTGQPVVISGGKDGLTHVQVTSGSLGGYCSSAGIHAQTSNGMFSPPLVYDAQTCYQEQPPYPRCVNYMNVMVSGDDGKGVQIWSPQDQCCNGASTGRGVRTKRSPTTAPRRRSRPGTVVAATGRFCGRSCDRAHSRDRSGSGRG